MEYYSAIKNEDILSFAGKWMELEIIILSEVTKMQKDMHGMYSLISGYQPKPTKQKKYRIPKIYSTELKKVSKLKCPNEDPPHPLSPTWKRKESNYKCGWME